MITKNGLMVKSHQTGHGLMRLGYLHSGAVAGVRVWLIGCGARAWGFRGDAAGTSTWQVEFAWVIIIYYHDKKAGVQ